jgi:PAS domain S-box-containing protein
MGNRPPDAAVTKGRRGALEPRRWPLRTYFVVLVLVFGSAAAVAALYVDRKTDNHARAEAGQRAAFAAKTAGTQLGNHLSLLRATVAQLAATPGIAKAFVDATGCSLSYQGIGGQDRGHLDIVRADGTVMCSSRPLGDGREGAIYAGSAWLRRALEKKVFEAPAEDRATGGHVAIAAAPVPGGRGVVAGFSDLSSVGSVLVALYGGGDPIEFLITTSDRKTVVTRSIDPDRWAGSRLRGTAFVQTGTGAERRDLDGTARLYEEFTMPSVGWHFYAGEDKAAALAAARDLRRSQLGIIVGGLIAFLLAAWIVYRKVVAPLGQLSAEVRSRTSGALEASPVMVGGPVEVAALGEDVNALISSVHRELDQRVRAEENYRILFEHNPNPMWVFDAETLRFLAVNDHAVHTYGYSRDEFLQMSIDDIRDPGEIERLHAIVRSEDPDAPRGLNPAGVWQHRRKDGTTFDVAVTSHTLTFEGREARVVLALDVTERVRAENALRASEARYRELFENASDLIATADLDGRLTAVNEAFVTALGYDRDELIGRALVELVPKQQRDRLSTARESKLAEPAVATVYEHELIAKDGRHVEVEVASRLIYREGTPIGIEAICRDITERKHLEAQLRQAQRIEAVGRLAGGIAHDFNNLLTVISGYAETLLGETDPRSEPDLLQIAAAAERAAVLTRQLLAFSRRQVLEPQILDPNEIVAGIAPMLTRLIGEHIELVTVADADAAMVCADAGQLEQVLVNLAVNARDAMSQGGKLTIETGNADLDEDYVAQHSGARVGPHAVISITDTGVGMDEETIAHMFDPFFTTKPVGKGTGLGLATVHGIVRQSGGNVWVYSEPGIGTTFKVYLPAAEGRPLAASGSMQAVPEAAKGSERILITEDEESLRTLTTRMLEQRGYSVIAAENAEHAIELVEQQPDQIDLLLTDLVMPQMSGRDLADSVRERSPSMRVLFMSGYADEFATENGSLAQGAAFLEKPFSGNDLARKVRQTLDA